MSGLPVFSENASGCPRHHWKHKRPATVIESMKIVLVAIEDRRLAVLRADRRVMRLAVGLIVPKRRVRAADEHREVTAFVPGARTDGVARPALDGEIASLKVKEESGCCSQRPQQRRFSKTTLAENAALDASRLCQPLISRNDRKGHHTPSRLMISLKLGAPVLTVRARSKLERICAGQAAYLRSETWRLMSTYSRGSSPSALMRSTNRRVQLGPSRPSSAGRPPR